MKMISAAVDHLDDLDTWSRWLRKLGQRHKIYGVEPGHYDTVGAALLWTLEQGLGEHYTPEVEQAWANAYGLLSGVMQDAAEDCEAAFIENAFCRSLTPRVMSAAARRFVPPRSQRPRHRIATCSYAPETQWWKTQTWMSKNLGRIVSSLSLVTLFSGHSLLRIR